MCNLCIMVQINLFLLKAVCKHLSDPDLTGVELIQHLHDAVNVYYNYTGTTPCFNTSEEAVASLGDLGWDFQVIEQFRRTLYQLSISEYKILSESSVFCFEISVIESKFHFEC